MYNTHVPLALSHKQLDLDASLPPARLALLKAVAQKAESQNLAFYIVGGFVRDLLMGRPGQDFDLVVEGDAIALAKAVAKQYGGSVVAHARFGTAKWVIGDIREKLAGTLAKVSGAKLNASELPESLDLVSARRESYAQPSALPTVEKDSIKLDLQRRDFTINTLALRLDGQHYEELLDYWGGLDDIQNGSVRVLHSRSFEDDPTRILRAVRFEQRFGFKIEADTLKLLEAALPLIARLSGDRLRHELDAILTEPEAIAMLTRLDKLGVLNAIHSAIRWSKRIAARLEEGRAAPSEAAWELGDQPLQPALSYALWLCEITAQQIDEVTGRLKLTRDLAKTIRATREVFDAAKTLADAPPSAVVEKLDGMPSLGLYAAYLSSETKKLRDLLLVYMKTWRHVHAQTTGNALRARGVPPGPEYKDILRRLRAARLDGEVTTDEEESALLEKLLNE